MASTSTVYSHALRVLTCDGCGAPLSASIAGGLATCSYCGATSQLAARDERNDRERAIESRGSAISESERMARLRDQASRDEPLPESIAALLAGGRIRREQAMDVLTLWKRTRATLRERGDFITAERLFHLTRVLLPHMDHEARRALLETAVESLPDHRHRHVLRCELAIGAARLGEVEAAEAWLEAVDPRPLDLLMDSAVRTARATVAIARGRGNDVLSELGDRPADVPAAGWYGESHELLRLHGLEMMCRYDEASGRLDTLVRDIGSIGLANAVAEHEPLRLLPRTRLAQQRDDVRHRRVALRRRQLGLERTPSLAAKVALISAALLIALVWIASSASDSWLSVGAMETAAQRVSYGHVSSAMDAGMPACLCISSMLLLFAIMSLQLPFARGARRRALALEAELQQVEAELAELERRLASMSRARR